MNSSGMQKDRGDGAYHVQPADEQLLELVLNETLAAQNQQAVFPIIVNFAGRNSNRKITEPIVAEALIQEILEKRLKQRVLPGDCLQWIAASILDDPESRSRLVDLWEMAKNQCR